MSFRLARSLTALFGEVNTRFPNRSKASDGWIGDPSHQTRDSDHNPWVKDGAMGVVTAVDITDDAAPGVPEIADLIVNILVRRRDPRVKYIIHESTIWRSYSKPGIPAWTPARYDGPNGHFKHAHISVLPEKALYDATDPWGLLEQANPNMALLADLDEARKKHGASRIKAVRVILRAVKEKAGPVRRSRVRAALIALRGINA